MTTAAPALRLVFWESTVGCNLECIHCRRLEVSKDLSKDDLTTQEALRLIDQIAECGRPILVFSGGEPLYRSDIFELGRHARGRGLLIALATNGTLVDEAMAGRIAEAGFDRVSISLDGADAATHDYFRGRGAFDKAMRAAELLRGREVPLQLNFTMAVHNAHQWREMIALAERIGAVALHLFLLVPVGCGVELADDQMLSSGQVERLLTELYEASNETQVDIKATCAPMYYRITRQRRAKSGNPPQPPKAHPHASRRPGPGHPGGHPGGAMHAHTKGCLAGTAVCFVSHKGVVMGCGYLPVPAGDVRRQSFREIWENSQVFDSLRNDELLTGKCGVCEFRKVCGGCRARAFYEYGDYLAEEPYCEFQPRAGLRQSVATGQ